jgi:hypothetical protein
MIAGSERPQRHSSLPPLRIAVATLAAVVGACSSPSEPPPSSHRSSARIETVPPRAPSCTDDAADVGGGTRGMWVWGTKGRLDDPNATAALLESVHEAGLTEIYLSVNNGVLADPRLPELMTALGGAGLRVEALMGEATWYQPDERPAMVARIDAVGDYNAHHTPGFAAVHLDIEPHQLPENGADHGFLPALAVTLGEATERASHFCMSTSADVPRFALDEAGTSFAKAVPRLFVMLYELREKTAPWLTSASSSVLDHTYAGLTPEERGRLVVSLRVEDYPNALPTMVSSLDDAHGRDGRYGGWAIHDEAKYRARPRR